jgi:indolepyruvate ferredoxin oxidoreductase alpha subunit
MTGHQQHPGTGHTIKGDQAPAINYEALIRALGVEHVEVVDPWDLEATEQAIKSGLSHTGPAVVIARRECMLLPEEKMKDHTIYQVDLDDCIECEECRQVGCPAMVWDGNTPQILSWQCNGCALCAQLCVTDAIGVVGGV